MAIEGLEGEAFAREHQHSLFDTLRLIDTMIINYNDQALSLHLVCLPVIITCDEILQSLPPTEEDFSSLIPGTSLPQAFGYIQFTNMSVLLLENDFYIVWLGLVCKNTKYCL